MPGDAKCRVVIALERGLNRGWGDGGGGGMRTDGDDNFCDDYAIRACRNIPQSRKQYNGFDCPPLMSVLSPT